MTGSSVQKSVLIVEDETLLRMVAIDMFEDAGFTVFAAETADEGAYILEDAPRIDTVFTDVETPGKLNGLALAKLTHDLHPEAAILVVSGRTRVAQSELPPRSRFIGKPYRIAQVLQALAQLQGGNERD
jgi:DNA-binding NtrC family response regulator